MFPVVMVIFSVRIYFAKKEPVNKYMKGQVVFWMALPFIFVLYWIISVILGGNDLLKNSYEFGYHLFR